MSKIDLYVVRINEILNDTNFSSLSEEKSRSFLQERLKNAFMYIYGKDFVTSEDCVEDEGFATIPALVKDSEGREYVGLIDICVQDSGEHYGTSIFTVEGVKDQKETVEFNRFVSFPYNYRPLVSIAGDIHTGAYY